MLVAMYTERLTVQDLLIVILKTVGVILCVQYVTYPVPAPRARQPSYRAATRCSFCRTHLYYHPYCRAYVLDSYPGRR